MRNMLLLVLCLLPGLLGASVEINHQTRSILTDGWSRTSLYRTTSNSNTATEMALDTAATRFLPALAAGDTYGMVAYVTARGTAGASSGKTAAYRLSCTVERTGVAANTRIIDSALEVLTEEEVTWNLTATADTTNARGRINVVGDASSDITWTGYVDYLKVR